MCIGDWGCQGGDELLGISLHGRWPFGKGRIRDVAVVFATIWILKRTPTSSSLIYIQPNERRICAFSIKLDIDLFSSRSYYGLNRWNTMSLIIWSLTELLSSDFGGSFTVIFHAVPDFIDHISIARCSFCTNAWNVGLLLGTNVILIVTIHVLFYRFHIVKTLYCPWLDNRRPKIYTVDIISLYHHIVPMHDN